MHMELAKGGRDSAGVTTGYTSSEVPPILRKRYYCGGDESGGPLECSHSLAAKLDGYLKESSVRPYRLRWQILKGKQLGWQLEDAVLPNLPASSTGGRLKAPPTTCTTSAQHTGPGCGGTTASWRSTYSHQTFARPPHVNSSKVRSSTPVPTGTKVGEGRYRRIEDLSFFMSTGTVNERTLYFKEPMQRRPHSGMDAASAQAQQCVIDVSVTDPRLHTRLQPRKIGESTRASRACIVPKKVLESMRKYEYTTAMVKPYALGTGCRLKGCGELLDLRTPHNTMNAYVLSMQCQRPTKGLYTYY